MDWKSFFSKPDSISTEMTREYIATHSPNEYQLLDVRQPNEYQSQHIPGAILIPLNELPSRMGELDRKKETIVYCRSGARSNSACQILRQNSFIKVLNMSGGILQWQGHSAVGPQDIGMDFFVNDTYANSLTMAYAMEQGLQQFYLLLAEKLSQPDVCALLKTMAKFEDGHMAQLLAKYKTAMVPPEKDLQIVEGGFSIEQLGRAFGEHLTTPESVIQLAMMFESQAYDLYGRLAHQEKDNTLKSFYLDMAQEERKHLDKLSGQLDNLLS